MEIEILELTVEDILNFHRAWITSLYLEDKKTDVEIVILLYEQGLAVTLFQIQKCIREWKLVRSASPELPPAEPDSFSEDSWEMISSPCASPAPTNISYTPSDPNVASLYAKRPLPSLPTCEPNPKTNNKSKIHKRQTPNADRLRVTCHHGSEPSDMHEVETTLCSLPIGPTQMELYVDDEQSHERVAVGLLAYPRSGHKKEGASRHRQQARVAKRTSPSIKHKKEMKSSSPDEVRGRVMSDEL